MKLKNKLLLLLAVSGFFLTQCVSVFGTSDHVDSTRMLSREDFLRQDILEYAKKQVGVNYMYGGKDPRGFDCSGFTHYVLKAFDIEVSGSSKLQAKEGKKVALKDVKCGDLIFFKRSEAGKVFHVAMVVSNTKDGLEVIHSTSRGVVIDNISKSKYWKPKISSARNVIDMALASKQ